MVGNRQGFTLVEVVIAILLLSIGVLAIGGSNGRMTRMLSRGERSSTAAVFGQEQIEILRAAPCASLTSSSTTREGAYELDWTVTSLNGGTIQHIELIVGYPGESEERYYTIETQIACVI